MPSVENIKERLASQKIEMAQIDPFSFCNAKCWFCPVRYTPNPQEAVTHMEPDVFERIIADIDGEKRNTAGIVAPGFNFIYTAHYNEVLLYRHFEGMVSTLKRYGIKTYVLTNGIPLTPKRVDFIRDNVDTVVGICLNVPAFERETWSKRSGMSESLFERLIANIKYAEEQLPMLTAAQMLTVQINGATDNSFVNRGGWLTKGPGFPSDMDLNPATGELALQYQLCKELFPTINTTPMPSLIDRAGLLDDAGVISNAEAVKKYLQDGSPEVVGCGNGWEVGGRPFGWLHVNARGDAFLCCNDYSFDYTFGNLATHSLRDIWVTKRHAEAIAHGFSAVCTKCASSVWV